MLKKLENLLLMEEEIERVTKKYFGDDRNVLYHILENIYFIVYIYEFIEFYILIFI